MRILLISPSMGVGGAERVVAELCRELAARDHEISLLAPAGERDHELTTVPINRYPLRDGRRSLLRSVRTCIEIASTIRRVKPQVVHAQNARIAAFSAIALCIARPLGDRPKLVATCHGIIQAEMRHAARMLRLASAVACVSADLADNLKRAGLRASRISIVANSAGIAPAPGPNQLAQIDERYGIPAGNLVAGIVARVVPEKAHQRFIHAAAVAAERIPNVHFLVVGDGPLRATVEARAEILGDRITFTGEVPDARELISRLDVLVFSSDSEGLSIAALEAMAAGTAVLSTDVSGMHELLAGGAGEVVASEDGTVLGERLEALLCDPERREQMGRIGIEEVQARYSAAKMTDAYEAIYRAVAGPR